MKSTAENQIASSNVIRLKSSTRRSLSHHGICFAGACLAVCKYRRVEPYAPHVEKVVDEASNPRSADVKKEQDRDVSLLH
jgi:hypothetical protein